MTKPEIKALELFVDEATEQMSNRGCCDTDLEILALFTSQALSELDKQYNDQNNTPEEHENGCYFGMESNWIMFRTLFNKAKKELEEGEAKRRCKGEISGSKKNV